MTAVRARASVGIVGLALMAAACGVPEDDAPRAVAVNEIPEALSASATTTSTPVDGVDANLYFIALSDGEPELRVQRSKVDNLQIETVLRALVNAVPENDLTSSIPPDLRILGTSIDNDVLTIDLSAEFSDVSGAPRTQAVAQLVLTATDLPRFEQVRFSVEGEDIPAPDADSVDVEGPVDRTDYRSLLPEGGG